MGEVAKLVDKNLMIQAVEAESEAQPFHLQLFDLHNYRGSARYLLSFSELPESTTSLRKKELKQGPRFLSEEQHSFLRNFLNLRKVMSADF